MKPFASAYGVMSVRRPWDFASDWYGAYLERPWRKRTPEQAREMFDRHGLTGAFLALD
jgi:hypothetical protein